MASKVVTAFRQGRIIATIKAIERLKTGTPGDTIDRSEMTNVIGRQCNQGSNGEANVRSAIQAVLREHNICWAWSKSDQAWRCLNDSEKVSLMATHRNKARKQSTKGLRVAVAVEQQNLKPDEKLTHGAMVAQFGVMQILGRSDTTKKLASGNKTFAQADQESVLKLCVLQK